MWSTSQDHQSQWCLLPFGKQDHWPHQVWWSNKSHSPSWLSSYKCTSSHLWNSVLLWMFQNEKYNELLIQQVWVKIVKQLELKVELQKVRMDGQEDWSQVQMTWLMQ